MKSDELLAKLAEINEKYGPIPVRVYNSNDVGSCTDEDDLAEIIEIHVDGMEVEVWV